LGHNKKGEIFERPAEMAGNLRADSERDPSGGSKSRRREIEEYCHITDYAVI
jgi:hypothetical protein